MKAIMGNTFGDAMNQAKKPRKERAQLSCTFCRHRKLKCDRQSPCNNCTKRAQGSSCYFTHPRGHRVEKGNTTDVQSRVKHLESLVLGLMSGHQNPVPLPTPADSLGSGSHHGSSASDHENEGSPDEEQQEQTVQALGRLELSATDTSYVGSEHWASILDDIAEVKRALEEEGDSPEDEVEEEPGPESLGPELLRGAGRMPPKEEILEDLPPKEEVDRLVTAYFNATDPMNVLLHAPTFESDYGKFWNDPSAAPMTFIALLFGVMSLSSFFHLAHLERNSEAAREKAEAVETYRSAAAQSLMMSNYTRPVRWTIEALMFYNMSEYIRSRDAQRSLWVVLGMVIRLAMGMGYHRDADHFPQISPFQGEMRRRAWALLTQLDVLTSVQAGLPRMIRTDQVDTRLPSNYFDSDLYEGMAALPPPRPDSQYTPMSYHVLKGRLTKSFADIADTIASTKPPSYDHILRLDADLTQVYDTMPYTLRVRRKESSATDSASLVFRRFTIEIMFHKCRCILHRSYIVPAQTNERYTYSLNCAMSSAKAILQHQCAVYEETKPLGRLYKDRWLLSGLTTEDFTLAAMIICLSIETLMQAPAKSDEGILAGDKPELIELIQKSHDIWLDWSRQPEIASEKSAKACQVLAIMLRKIRGLPVENNGTARAATPGAAMTPAAASMMAMTPPSSIQSVHEAQFTPQQNLHPLLFASAPSPANKFEPDFPPPVQQLTPDSTAAAYPLAYPELPITEWIDAPQDINWNEWDDFFQPPADPMDLHMGVWNANGNGTMNGFSGLAPL